MKKRALLVMVAILILVGLTMTGCGKKNADSVADNTVDVKVTIEFIHDQAEEPRIKARQGIIDDFMALNPNIIVKQIPTPEDAFGTKVTTLISSNKLPAITEGSIDMVRMMTVEGVVDTQANAEVIKNKTEDAFYKGALDFLKSDDNGYMGVPMSGWVAGIWYRKDLFAEKNLAAPDTWENILKAAQAFYDPAQKKYGIVFATEESDFTEQTFTQFALSNNAELFDADGKPKFNSPEMKSAIQFYKELYQYGPKGSNGVTQVKDAFVAGHAAMTVYSTYIMPTLFEQQMADKIGFTIPTHQTSAGFGMTSTVTISNMLKPEERAAAIKFITYMLDKDVNTTWCHMAPGGANPVLKEVASYPKYTSHELLKAFGETSSQVPESFNNLMMFGFQNGKTHPKMGTISSKLIIPKAINAILVQNADIDKTLEKAQKEMEAVVNE